MTTLLTLPGSTAYHIPAPNAAPVPLAKGDLTLSLLPADPPRRAADQLALSVGQTSFLLAANSPVRKTKSNSQHASFIFTPAPPAEGQGIGTVRIDMKDSTNPDEWEDTERKCAALEAELRARNLWEDTELFVDDEDETGGPQVGPKKGWGESIAGAIFGGASSLVSKITGRSKSQEVLPTSRGAYDGGYPPSPSVETPPAGEEQQKPQHFKALAEHSWAQATIAARGIGEAAAAVGGAVGQTAKNAYDGIKDGVSERDEIPDLPAKDAPKAPVKQLNTDKPVPPAPAPAKDEVDALAEPKPEAPIVVGAIKNVKLNEVVPITPSEPDHPVENIVPEPAKVEEKLKAVQPEAKKEEASEPEPSSVKTAEKEKPVEEAVKELKIEDEPKPAAAAAAESAKVDAAEIKEEAAAVVAASDAEIKAEEEVAKDASATEPETAEEAEAEGEGEGEDEAKDSASDAKDEQKPKTGASKKKNKKNKKKN